MYIKCVYHQCSLIRTLCVAPTRGAKFKYIWKMKGCVKQFQNKQTKKANLQKLQKTKKNLKMF